MLVQGERQRADMWLRSHVAPHLTLLFAAQKGCSRGDTRVPYAQMPLLLPVFPACDTSVIGADIYNISCLKPCRYTHQAARQANVVVSVSRKSELRHSSEDTTSVPFHTNTLALLSSPQKHPLFLHTHGGGCLWGGIMEP